MGRIELGERSCVALLVPGSQQYVDLVLTAKDDVQTLLESMPRELGRGLPRGRPIHASSGSLPTGTRSGRLIGSTEGQFTACRSEDWLPIRGPSAANVPVG